MAARDPAARAGSGTLTVECRRLQASRTRTCSGLPFHAEPRGEFALGEPQLFPQASDHLRLRVALLEHFSGESLDRLPVRGRRLVMTFSHSQTVSLLTPSRAASSRWVSPIFPLRCCKRVGKSRRPEPDFNWNPVGKLRDLIRLRRCHEAGFLRPSSQFMIVNGDTPTRSASSACVRPNLFLRQRIRPAKSGGGGPVRSVRGA